ncbi:MAG TPA: CBS domain-containing protein [Thermoanaerobaculia bacterium]|nr:CBS domain-containing protein [Thermoanaerobaculia bacterium]
MAQQKKSGPGSRNVRDVMTPNPDCISSDASIQDAARIMKEKDTGVVPVVDGKRVVGLITDRDIVVRGIAEGKDLSSCRVDELMTKSVRSVREDAPVDEVLTLMSSSEIRRVPVVNGQDEIVGIISIGDIAVETNKDGRVGKAIEDISQAPPNN